jgi:hypothetical protein
MTHQSAIGSASAIRRRLRVAVLGSLLAWPLQPVALAQRGGQAVPDSARAEAPVDLTGSWVSVVTEDWAWRMRTPANGDYASVPLNDAGRARANEWNAADDGSCLAYGAAQLLRHPGRLRIDWLDDDTLELRADNGAQTRLLHFAADAPRDLAPSLQGYSRARWQTTRSVTASGATGGILTATRAPQAWASLEVMTTGLAAAWLRPNGVPVSENARLTEYFDVFADGDEQWVTITMIVEDPDFLTEPFVASPNFRREPDASNWNPRPCKAVMR